MATQKSNNPAIVAMQEMMQRRIEQEPEFALKMANPNKSMEGAINFLCNEVKKSGLCVLTDEAVEAILVHYWDEEDIKAVDNIGCNIVVSKPELSEADKAELKEQAMEQYREEQLRELRRQSQPKTQLKPTATAPKAGAEIDSIPNLFDEFYPPKTMRPKTLREKHIVELNGRLRPLTTPQMNWALDSTINHYGYRLKSGMCTCMKCGHEWLETRNGMCLCPECGTRIEIKDTKDRVIRDKSYFNVITTIEGYQVIRMFLMIVEMRKGMKAKPAFLEIGSYWIDCKGNTTVVGLQRTLGHYIDSFAFGSPLEIRRDNEAFQRISDEWVYPRINVTDTIKRNGFKGSCHHIHPVTLFQELLTNPKAETLMKSNEIELLRYLCYRPTNKADIEDYWNSIKIAKRNGYKVNNSQMWIDYIKMLERCGRDIQSPKYICPANIQEEHDRYVRKVHTLEDKRKRAEDIRKAQEREASFKEQKEKFFGIRINDGEIEVKVLESVEEYRQEAESQHICLFSAAYDQREDSLIFSARINGRIIETIEVDLKTLKVVQSRGVCNQNYWCPVNVFTRLF